MEREKDPSEELQIAGRQASDALRGYGYTDFAQEYERSLHRSALDPKEMFAHSRIANATLKELNELSEERLVGNPKGKHPALERNIQVQENLDAALQKQQGLNVERPKSIEDLSFPAKMYLEENSKPLENAAQEAANYLDEKRAYSHPTEGKTQLQRHLDIQLQSYRSLPTSHNMERLEKYTKEGVEVMRNDFEHTKQSVQKGNEDYVRERQYLSTEGKAFLLREAEKGEFTMPNQQKGYTVESRTDYAQQQLDQYTKTKEQIFSIDQERSEGPSWKQALSMGTPAGPAIEKDMPETADGLVDKTAAWKNTLAKDYSHLSPEQQERYADLQSKVMSVQPTNDQEVEL